MNCPLCHQSSLLREYNDFGHVFADCYNCSASCDKPPSYGISTKWRITHERGGERCKPYLVEESEARPAGGDSKQ